MTAITKIIFLAALVASILQQPLQEDPSDDPPALIDRRSGEWLKATWYRESGELVQ